MFLNIVLNAIAASPTGGSVVLRTARDGRGVSVSITDEGDGIAPADVSRVFGPFFTTKDTGTGLGLSISHAIIEDHGGSITVDSTPVQGATFVVTLPDTRSSGGGHGA